MESVAKRVVMANTDMHMSIRIGPGPTCLAMRLTVGFVVEFYLPTAFQVYELIPPSVFAGGWSGEQITNEGKDNKTTNPPHPLLGLCLI
jgi:hypothetical protein